MRLKSTVGIIFGLFFAVGYMVAQPPKVTEQTVPLERFGFKAGSCDYRQSAQFLDDDHLVLSAPLVGVCDKSNWSNALQTQLTIYSATGCYLGDFDDCYSFIFKRVAVFDPQTHQALFNQKVGRDATSILSPNGHTVVVLDKTKVHIYMIP